MKKPLSSAPPRLARILLALSKYEVNVCHIPGKNIPVSDCLSRQSLPDTFPKMIEGLDYHVHTVQKRIHVIDKRLASIRFETAKDPQMIKLKRTIVQSWPESRSKCDVSIVECFNHCDEKNTEDGLIFRGVEVWLLVHAHGHVCWHSWHLGLIWHLKYSLLMSFSLSFWLFTPNTILSRIISSTVPSWYLHSLIFNFSLVTNCSMLSLGFFWSTFQVFSFLHLSCSWY